MTLKNFSCLRLLKIVAISSNHSLVDAVPGKLRQLIMHMQIFGLLRFSVAQEERRIHECSCRSYSET